MSPNDYFSSTRLTRRDTIRLLAGFAGVGAAVGRQGPGNPLPSGTLMAAQLPKGGIIRTALKDMPPESLGQILVHEHIQATSIYAVGGQGGGQITGGGGQTPVPAAGEAWVSQFSNNMDPARGEVYTGNLTENIDLMIEEMQLALKDGITAIVDCGPPLHWTQRPEYLRQLSKLSGMPIIIGGGYHTGPRYPAEIARMSEDDIVEQFLRESVPARWGAMAEIGCSAPITPDERKVNRAAGRMQALANLPIISHTPNGALAVEQLDLFESAGAKAPHILIGHMGAQTMVPIDVFKTICRRGAFVGFDRVGSRPESDAAQVPMIRNLIEAGYVDNILLSSDGGGNLAGLKSRGGSGWSRAFTVMGPKLRQAGVEETALRKIMVDNPRRLLTFVPKKG
jgi:phosphotriesterase-related protein